MSKEERQEDMRSSSYDDWLHQRLRDPDRAARYLAEYEAHKKKEPELYALALRDIEAAKKLNWPPYYVCWVNSYGEKYRAYYHDEQSARARMALITSTGRSFRYITLSRRPDGKLNGQATCEGERQKEREAYAGKLREVIARLKANPNFSEPNFYRPKPKKLVDRNGQ